MSRVAAPDEIDAQLAELERQRGEGAISDLTFTVQRNLLITRAQQAARRRDTARRLVPPPPPPPPPLPPHGGGRWQRMLSSRSAAWILGVAFAAGVTLLAYHLGGSSAPSGSAPATTPTPAAADSPTPRLATAPASSASVIPIDRTQATPGGGTVTLIGYQSHFSPTSVINNPLPSGAYYLAVQLKVCAGIQGSVTVSPFDYVLVEPDHTQVDISSGPAVGVQPALQLTQLSPGHCTTGWLSYGVVVAPTSFTDNADNLSWPMP